ncbi:hypothetical protein WG947_15110 [Pontibacter sp. H259]|uniref:hypothetical protein n=1 Tax=Pontibacter sp. H259 TaxID=3133421 RepID=UPI0030BFA20E
MRKMWQQLRFVVPVAVLVLLFTLPCPLAIAHNGTNTSQTTASQTTPEDQAAAQKAAAKPKPKPVAKTRDKSVLDAEVLDRPLSYFKEAFTPEEDNESGSPALVNTVKALVATLLSTVM